MLVLLIIFMVTAPLVQQGIEVQLPETRSTNSISIKENDIILSVNKNKEIYIEKTQLKLNEVTAKLKEIYKNKKKKEIYLRADKSIPYGFVIKIMALVKNAGIDQMGMITDAEI